MRKIEKAVLIQTIERGYMRTESTQDVFQEGYKGPPTEFLTKLGTERVLSLLSKYIVFKDHNQAYWVDRYWYFDVEKYMSDLSCFGIDMAMPVRSDIRLPNG